MTTRSGVTAATTPRRRWRQRLPVRRHGNDTMTGGQGDDVVHGDEGNDTIYGGDGVDTIFGGDGDDYIEAGRGDDDVTGGLGNDIIIGDEGFDELWSATRVTTGLRARAAKARRCSATSALQQVRRRSTAPMTS